MADISESTKMLTVTQADVTDADRAAVTAFHTIQIKRIIAGDKTMGDNRDVIEQAFARHRIEAERRATRAALPDPVKLAERFCATPLPETVSADLCATQPGPGRYGTNLMTVAEAAVVFRAALSTLSRAAPPAMDREAVERVREAAYRQALEDVCNPLGYLQRMADAEGAKLSGMAYAIASDIGTIQRIAKEALSTLSADAIRQGEGWQPISDADTSQERLTVLGYGTFRGRSHPQVVVLDWVKWIGSWSAYTMPFEPTHWMPLPATPASHASDGGKA